MRGCAERSLLIPLQLDQALGAYTDHIGASVTSDFQAQVKEQFAFLITAGYSVVDSVDGESFDNAYTTFKGSRLLIGVARERGQYYFEVGAPGTSRYDHQLLAELTGDAGSLDREVLSRPRLGDLAELLDRQLAQLERAFAPDRVESTKHTLRRLGEERADRLFGQRLDERAT